MQGQRGEGTHFRGHPPCLLIPVTHCVPFLNPIPPPGSTCSLALRIGYPARDALMLSFPQAISEGQWVQVQGLSPKMPFFSSSSFFLSVFFFFFSFLFSFFGCDMWGFLGQGSDLHHSCDNTRPLTHRATRELKCPTFSPHLLFVFFFLGPHPRHMEVPKLVVRSGLQLLANATAPATLDPSCVCNLHHSSQQRQTLNPLSKARDQTHVLMDPSHGPVVQAADKAQIWPLLWLWLWCGPGAAAPI